MDTPENELSGTPVKVTDVTLRDGHQSIFATRMRTEDMEPITDEMDRMGFFSIEMWGGATFDVAHRFLNEDPWDRVRKLKRQMPKTPLQMLLRGQNLVGYRNYPDDVVKAFVRQSAEVGIDIFRVFDALNDERNMETCFAAIKESGKHIQGTISYSITEERLGGPVFTLDYYVNKALTLQRMGADSLCIKDMSGLLNPYDAYDLVRALKTRLSIPIQLHTHYTSGMAAMTTLKTIEAGIDVIDASLAPFALRSSHPAVESMAAALKNTSRQPPLDLSRASSVGKHLEEVFPKYRDYMDTTRVSIIDTQVLNHQIPGGMISNLISQLREADALDRLDEVYEELKRVRADLGYPPLVTPTSQMVGTQAVQNVLFGRYETISTQVRDYVYGLYGKPPAPIDAQLAKMALKDYERGQQSITSRAADLLDDELAKAKHDTKDIAKGMEDVLTYALFPVTGMRFLKWKYGLEEPPAEASPKTLEEVAREDQLIREAKEGVLEANAAGFTPDGHRRSFSVWVGDEHFQVEVSPSAEGRASSVEGEQATEVSVPPALGQKVEAPPPRQDAAPPSREPVAVSKEEVKREAPPQPVPTGNGSSIVAPMPGIVIRYEVEEGQQVTTKQSVVILETMKMENSLPSPVDGTITSLPCRPGQSVGKGDVLAVIS